MYNMVDKKPMQHSKTHPSSAVLVLQNGQVLHGQGCGYIGEAIGEVCFNTAMTGYQEILTDPSYAAQIICFTFPHIGNTGCNSEDEEAASLPAQAAARGAVFKAPISVPSNWRAQTHLHEWLRQRRIIAISGIDTRALTTFIRDHGMINGLIAHHPDGRFDMAKLHKRAQDWPGLAGADLAGIVQTPSVFDWQEDRWHWPEGYQSATGACKKVVVIDYGVKRNILRHLNAQNLAVSIVPANADIDMIMALQPDGIVLSNGPGDPAATAHYALAVIRDLIATQKPILGICLGHQLLALALGANTVKMNQGHHGANHPVMDCTTRKVEIVSMNHGFCVDRTSLPDTVEETHISLFDGSNCGLRLKGKPVFSIQYHPEASPGPQDSLYLFEHFAQSL